MAIKLKQRWEELRKRISKKNETRFFKKHGVSSWRAYDLKYDTDYNAKADSIRNMFHGYPYIAEITSPDALARPANNVITDGYTVLKNWLENSCRGKARCVLERTIEHTARDLDGGILHKDWIINGIGGKDSLFIAFKDERDYLMFLLKWETS